MANGVGIPVSGSREEREGWFPNQWVGELQYLPVFVPRLPAAFVLWANSCLKSWYLIQQPPMEPCACDRSF